MTCLLFSDLKFWILNFTPISNKIPKNFRFNIPPEVLKYNEIKTVLISSHQFKLGANDNARINMNTVRITLFRSIFNCDTFMTVSED